ncbi:unnamed protein product [marine sediment metagenome]|uniref:Uncharacterized protein n=1 Tax=marine sediment metagenome TaxID=412755 RepID=X0W629_9ZZZZ
MSKKGQMEFNLLGQAVIFLGLWLVTSLIWSIWLEGILAPIAGAITSLAALGFINFNLHLHR